MEEKEQEMFLIDDGFFFSPLKELMVFKAPAAAILEEKILHT